MTLTRRQNYYDRLVALGLPEVIAASMAAQSTNCIVRGGALGVVYGFHSWEETIEGPEFWLLFANSYEIQTLQP